MKTKRILSMLLAIAMLVGLVPSFTLTASAAETYTVTIADGIANGTVTGGGKFAEGETVTLTVTPNSGYKLNKLTVTDASGGAVTVNSDNTFTMPAGNATVTATFKIDSKAMIFYANNGTNQTYVMNKSSTWTLPTAEECGFTAPAGKILMGWALNSASGKMKMAGQQGYRAVSGGNAFYAVWTDPVASVTVSGTTTDYSNLVEAFSAASGKEAEIKLLSDWDNSTFAEHPQITSNTSKVTFDLNGHKITNSSTSESNALEFAGECVIKNGEVTFTGGGQYILFNSGAKNSKLTISGDTKITNTNPYGCAVLVSNGGNTVVVEDGAEITVPRKDNWETTGVICLYTNATLIVNGGTISSSGTRDTDIAAYSTSNIGTTVVVNGGNFDTIKADNVYFNVDHVATVTANVTGNAWYKLTNSIPSDTATLTYTENTTVYEGITYGLGGADVKLTASPASGMTVSKILANDTEAASSEGVYSFTMPNELVTLTADSSAATPTTYTVMVNNGSGSGEYAEGEYVHIYANTPEDGKQFAGWAEGLTGLQLNSSSLDMSSVTFVMPARDVTLTATYEDAVNYTITVSANPSEGGTVTGGGTYAKDSLKILNATPNTGYKFVNWTENGNPVSTDAQYIIMVQADCELVANFESTTDPGPTYTVSVLTVDKATGNALTGADIQILEVFTTVATWTSTDTAHEVTGLSAGVTYTPFVTRPPLWYNPMTLPSFSIDADGNIITTGSVSDDGVLLIEFERQTGTLTVQNTVENADAADGDTEFTFTVTVLNNPLNGTYGDMTFNGGVATVTLKANESAEATGLPAGISYNVSAAQQAGYVLTSSENSQGFLYASGSTAVFTHAKNTFATITFHANNGTGGTDTKTTAVGSQYTLTGDVFAYGRCVIESWNTEADGSGTSYAPGNSIEVTGDTALYAQWVLSLHTLDAFDDGNLAWTGKDTAPYTFTINSSTVLYAKIIFPAQSNDDKTTINVLGDFEVKGAVEFERGTAPYGGNYKFDLTVTGDGSLKLYDLVGTGAGDTLTVETDVTIASNHVSLGGSGGMDSKIVIKDGATLTLYNLNLLQYLTMEGTATLNILDGTASFHGYPEIALSDNAVIFIEGNGTDSVLYKENGENGAFDKLITDNWLTAGYSFREDGNGYSLYDAGDSLETDSVTVKKSGSASATVYTITYVLDGGTINGEYATSYAFGEGVSLPQNVTREGYYFAGWYDAAEGGTGPLMAFGRDKSGDLTVYARWTPKTYTVTWFNDDYSVLEKDENVPYGTTPSYDGETPAKAASAQYTYTFDGWTPEVAKVTGNATYRATYSSTAKTYTITYVLDGGTINGEYATSYAFGEGVSLPQNVTREGYYFAGWYDAAEGGTGPLMAFGRDKSGDLTVYARWTPKTYTVKFVDHDGTEIDSQTVNYGTAATAPADPVREGYTFTGWDKEIPTTMPAENVTITAQWKAITFFIVLRESADDGAKTKYVKAQYDAPLDMSQYGFPRDGYVLKSWSSKGDGTGMVNCDADKTIPADQVNILFRYAQMEDDGYYYFAYLTAQWEGFFIVLRDSTEAGADTKYVWLLRGDSLDMSRFSFHRKGYTLKSWSSKGDGTGMVNCDADKTIPAEELESLFSHSYVEEDGYRYFAFLTAQWQPNPYTITFNADGGSAINPITQDYNTSVEKPADPAKTGFDFGGWYADEALTTAYVFGTMPAENITVYAKWNPATGTAYTVKYYHQNTSDSGYTLYESETLRGTTNAKTAAEAKNYPGFTAQTFTQTAILPDGSAVVEIKYNRNTYTVTLATNNGTIRDGDVTEYTYGVGAKLPTNVTRSGYYFGGWYDNEDCKGTSVTEITTADIGNKTFYAKWNVDITPFLHLLIKYDVKVANDIVGGVVTTDKAYASAYKNVNINAVPAEGYAIKTVKVIDAKGNTVTVTANGEGKYSFKMPIRDVTVYAVFDKTEVSITPTTCPKDHTCPIWKFPDAQTTAWYHDGVHYCIEHGLMQGVSSSEFAPNGNLSRAMLVMILWRLEGKPVVNYTMSFEDVEQDTWYSEAIRWAASEKIVLGHSAERFAPNDDITREQLAAIIYRYEQYKGGGFTGAWMFRMDYTDLEDVSDWAYEAMCWCTMKGIINGKPEKLLDPKGTATRAQAAAMIYRYCEKDK